MAAAKGNFVPLDPQLFDRTHGEAVAALVRGRYPSAKALARAWDIELCTAENVWRGHCSIRTLFSGIKADGWEFLAPLGQAVTGLTYDEAQERAITRQLEEARRAREDFDKRRARRQALQERTARLVDGLDWPDAR